MADTTHVEMSQNRDFKTGLLYYVKEKLRDPYFEIFATCRS